MRALIIIYSSISVVSSDQYGDNIYHYNDEERCNEIIVALGILVLALVLVRHLYLPIWR